MAKEIDGQPERQHKMLPPTKVGKYENGMDLPSFGMSNFMDLSSSEQVQQLMKNINKKDGKPKLPGPVPIAPGLTSESKSKENKSQYSVVYSREDITSSTVTPTVVTGQEEGEVVICVGANDGTYLDQNIYDPSFPFTAGRTEPVATTSTVDTSQLDISQIEEIGDGALFGESAEKMITDELPNLEVKVNGYSRFRYQSERNSANKRPRHYDMDEDKRCLAEVKLKKYIGRAKVIAHCVNRDGKLHPYSLYGNYCHNGVFVQMFEFSSRRNVLKLLKVSITTPKAKEYGNSIKEQQRYLEELNVLQSKEIPTKGTDHGDKQVVYLSVKVILEDNKGILLQDISKEIRNKKEGTEFKIRSVIPCWAPVSGPSKGNPDKTKVYVIVTDNTAFPNPKDVCIVLRKDLADGKTWMRALVEPHINVIRKTVVEFTPPAFRDCDATDDVDVELVLKDKKTGQETDPVIFTYKGIDEYGVMGKGKKRKHDTLLSQEMMNFNTGAFQAQERKTLHALRKRGVSNKEELGSSSDGSDSSSDNSQVLDQMNTQVTSVADTEISIGNMRQNRNMMGRSQATATVTTSAVYPSQVPTPQTPQSGMITAQPALSAPGANLGANSAAQISSNPGLESLLNQILLAQFTQNKATSQISEQPAVELSSLSSLDLLSLLGQFAQQQGLVSSQDPNAVSQPKTAPVPVQPQPQVTAASFPVQSQPQVTTAPVQQYAVPVSVQSCAPQVPTQPSMPPQPVIDPNVILPKLKSNQMLAVINGQIVIINDDTVDTSGDNTSNAGGSNMLQQQQQPTASGGMSVQVPAASQGGLQYQLSGNFIQTNPSYVVTQGNQMPSNQFAYQQNPTMTSAVTGNQTVFIQQSQSQGQNGYQSSTSTVPWYHYGERLEDDDLEIDSGASSAVGNDKKVKRHKVDKAEEAGKNIDTGDSEISYMNLPKVIADVSDSSEEDGEPNTKFSVVNKNNETVIILCSESDGEVDEMQS